MRMKIRLFLEGIKNIWKWRKVIYRDKNWDHWFIYEVLKTKLQFQAEYMQKHGYHERASEDAKQMLECVDLIDKVQNEYYLDEAMRKDIWDFNEVEVAEKKQVEAKKKLFKLLEKNIENWWD